MMKLVRLYDLTLMYEICILAIEIAFISPYSCLGSEIAFFNNLILASSAAPIFRRAKEVGHKLPSSRYALSLKPSVEYLALNLLAG